MNRIAATYVRLVLAVGEHDEGYVDAYYGPQNFLLEARALHTPLPTIKATARGLVAQLDSLDPALAEDMVKLRHRFLHRQLEALIARVSMLQGDTLTFDEESEALYDAVAPQHDAGYFERILGDLEDHLPGQGPLETRLERFKRDFVIPPARLDTVFKAAIAEARRRTLVHLRLPSEETFRVEYVTDKPWSGYNWYQGKSNSLIQVNTDLPIYIDRAIDLAAHEGYPGHHVYNVLLEKHLVDERGWVEFSVYPLFSPQSLIAEGSANYGIEMAFPHDERIAFERDVLFPLAGLDPGRAEEYNAVMDLVARLSYAGNEAARQYLDGEIDAEAAASWLEKYALMAPDRARQRVRFIETYRSYVINYNLGKDLVQTYVENGAGDDVDRRWEVFGELLSSPRLPSELQSPEM